MKEELIKIIAKRYSYILDNDSNDFFIAATYLDFNYRKFSYVQNETESNFLIEKAKKFIKSLANRICKEPEVSSDDSYSTSTPLSSNTTNSNSISSSIISAEQTTPIQVNRNQRKRNENNFLNRLQDPNYSESQVTRNQLMGQIEIEFEIYDNKIFRFSNIYEDKYKAFEFFKIFQKELVNLANIAQVVFSVTASSVPSENLFSDAGQIQNDLRNRLDPSILDMINFIKSNYYS